MVRGETPKIHQLPWFAVTAGAVARKVLHHCNRENSYMISVDKPQTITY